MRHPDRRRAGCGPCRGHRSPRSQAGQRDGGRLGPRQGARLRPCQADRRRRQLPRRESDSAGREPEDGSGHHHGDRRVHVSRAGRRQAGGSPLGHLLVRRAALRDAHRAPRLPGRVDRIDACGDPHDRARAALGRRLRPAPRARADRLAMHAQATGEALAEHRGRPDCPRRIEAGPRRRPARCAARIGSRHGVVCGFQWPLRRWARRR